MYNTVGGDQNVKDIIAEGETPQSKKLLVEAFEQMLSPVKEPASPANTPAPVTKQSASNAKATAPSNQESGVMQDSFDEVLQSLKERWTKPYQQMNYLRHQLDKTFDDNDSIEAINYRKGIAGSILELEQECIQVWNERAYYLKNGKLPNVAETKIAVPQDPVKLANLISNITKNIRRNRKAMADHPAQPKYAQLFQEYNSKYKEITGKDYDQKK